MRVVKSRVGLRSAYTLRIAVPPQRADEDSLVWSIVAGTFAFTSVGPAAAEIRHYNGTNRKLDIRFLDLAARPHVGEYTEV